MEINEAGKLSTEKELGNSSTSANSPELSRTSPPNSIERDLLEIGGWSGTGQAKVAPKTTGHPSDSEIVPPKDQQKNTADPLSAPEPHLKGIDLHFMGINVELG